MERQFKNIDVIIPPPAFHMVGDGFRVHNFFPSRPEIGISKMSPFFLLDYGSKWNVPPSDTPRGVGVHPHRGFETVTIAYRGNVAHHDSFGNSGVINPGDVQWMTAGSGLLHKEYHEKEFSKKGGTFQMVQLWVNLPSKFKMTPPKYQAIQHKNMPRYELEDNKGYIEVIAGEYKNLKGPATTFTPINMFNARIRSGAKTEFSFSRLFNCGMLLIEGEIKVNQSKTVPENHFLMFGHDGEEILIEAIKDSIVLILSGEPIEESIATSGPFVMNTNEEIREAYHDFRTGKFGYLED